MIHRYPKEVVDDVKRMVLDGLSVRQIGKELRHAGKPTPTSATIQSWITKYKLREATEKVRERATEKLVETQSDMRDRQIRLAKAAQMQFVKDLKAGKIKVSAGEAERWAKHELLLWGEATDRTEVVGIDLIQSRLKEAYKNSKK